MMVSEVDSRIVLFSRSGDCSSGVLGLPTLTTFEFPLPTRTTWARTGMAVWALALFRKVEPTLKVLPLGLGGRRPLYFS